MLGYLLENIPLIPPQERSEKGKGKGGEVRAGSDSSAKTPRGTGKRLEHRDSP